MPFCDVNRLTTPSTNAAGSRSSPKRVCSAALLTERRAMRLASKRAARCGSVAGFHTASSMPLRMPVKTPGPLAQQAVEPHPVLGRADLGGVGRRHRGDPVGQREPRLEVADRAVVFDAVQRIGMRRQADPREELARKLSLKRQVVHRHDRARPRRASVMEQRGNEARLPVVGVDDVGPITRDGAAGDRGGARGERREAKPVVGPFVPVGSDIGLPGRA